MPQEDDGTSELNHPEEILWVVFPANHDTTKVMQPRKQSFDFPTAAIATQAPAILCCRCDAHKFVRRDELHAVALLEALVQGIAVVSTIADHSLGRFGKELSIQRGFDEFCFMRRSAGHVHGERKTMAVCDCHDFAAFAAFCRADTRAPFFGELKLASMKDSLRSSFPRSRKSSRPGFAASASVDRCAARIGNVDDRLYRADSETEDRARERRCVRPTARRSTPPACLSTVGLADLSAAWDETAAPEMPTGRSSDPYTGFTLFRITCNRAMA